MKNDPKVGVIDYGAGNIQSAYNAFAAFSSNIEVVQKGDSLDSCDALVIPGVGAYRTGMEGLAAAGFIEPIKLFIASGKSVMGICLGAQLLLSEGQEFGVHPGLGVVPGSVVKFNHQVEVKLPHVGWSSLYPKDRHTWKNTILDSVAPGEYTYFVHSFVCVLEDKDAVIAVTDYCGQQFCAAYKVGNVYGLQFHPEKSGRVGLKIIENFLKLSYE